MPPRLILCAILSALATSCATSTKVEPPGLTRDGPAWARVLRHDVDPTVVVDADLRATITATGLPWLVVHEATGIELVLVPPGEFLRGAPENDTLARDEERPAHAARVTHPFYIGRYEVTQAQWSRIMDENPSEFRESPDQPLENATVPQVHQFAVDAGLELPTEIEWEWACRAGAPAARYAPLEEIAWCAANAGQRTHEVGKKLPNGFGLYDMLGNVWELCRGDWGADVYAALAEHAPVDQDFERASWRGRYYQSFRGGAWLGDEAELRASRRQRFSPGYGFSLAGFRVSHGLE